MTDTLDASGQTGLGGTIKDLWDAGLQDGADTIFIQNQSGVRLTVLVTPTQVGGQANNTPLRINLPADGDYVLDARVVSPDAKVQVVCASQGATFTAFRGKSA